MSISTNARKAPDPAPLPSPSRILLTVPQLARQQPALTEGSIRWAIFNERENGLAKSGALVRAGRRVLINPELYLAWLESNPPSVKRDAITRKGKGHARAEA